MGAFGTDNNAFVAWVTCHTTALMVPGKQAADRSSYEDCGGNVDQIAQCAQDRRSLAMLQQAGEETQTSQWEQVPWVTMPSQPAHNLQGSLLQTICGKLLPADVAQPQCCARALLV